ncbi:MAG: hypothetical protein II358_01535 [Tidjanibacter sp.]|nr:hypothetical protein [Tidjanibacter sp.]
MRTIRKRISWGFIALSCVLVGSGIINIAEMGRLRKATENIIDAGMQSTEYATDMLNALQKQNSAVLGMVILNNATPSENYHNGVYEFNAALIKATDAAINTKSVNRIYEANENYHKIVELHSQDNSEAADRHWFMTSYLEAYYALDSAIKYYMTSPNTSISARTASLEESIYKTITPSIITLMVALVVTLMLFFFIDTYYIRPVKRIGKTLGNHIASNAPYQVKIEDKSELTKLNDDITELVGRIKKQQ